MSNAKDTKTQDLLDNLVETLEPVRTLPHPLMRLVPWLAFAVVYLGSAIYILGARPDFLERFYDPLYLFEMIIVATMAMFAAISSVFLCVPDMRGQNWFLNVAFCLFGVFLLWTGVRMMFEFTMPHIHWHKCYLDSIIFGLIPALAIWWLSMRGKTTHPFLLSSMNTLAIGGLGYIGLRLTCVAENIGHLCCYHILPYIIFGAVAGLVGRRIYRW